MWAITSEYMAYIKKREYEFRDEVQLKLFIGLVMNLYNHTRMYNNCGHTP